MGLEMSNVLEKANDAIREAASEVIGHATARKTNGWFDEECKDAVSAKKELRVKMLGRNSRSNTAALKQQNIQTYRLLRRKKREHLIKVIENLEAHNRNGDVREFYRSVKKSRNGFKANSIKIQNESGELLSDKTEILKRWTEYFRDLLNKPQLLKRTTHSPQRDEPDIEEPSLD